MNCVMEYEYIPIKQVWCHLWQYFKYAGNVSVWNVTNSLTIIQRWNRILDCVRNSVKSLLRMRKGEHFHILYLTKLRAHMLYAATQQRPPPAWPRTLWPSRISPVSSSRDSYGIPHNNRKILRFAYSITNFVLTILWSSLWTFSVKKLVSQLQKTLFLCPINHRSRTRLSPWIIRNMEWQRFIKKLHVREDEVQRNWPKFVNQ